MLSSRYSLEASSEAEITLSGVGASETFLNVVRLFVFRNFVGYLVGEMVLGETLQAEHAALLGHLFSEVLRIGGLEHLRPARSPHLDDAGEILEHSDFESIVGIGLVPTQSHMSSGCLSRCIHPVAAIIHHLRTQSLKARPLDKARMLAVRFQQFK